MLTAELIRLIRTSKNLSQLKFAERIKTSQTMVSYLENGICEITPEIESRIKKAFRLNNSILATLEATCNEINEDGSESGNEDIQK